MKVDVNQRSYYFIGASTKDILADPFLARLGVTGREVLSEEDFQRLEVGLIKEGKTIIESGAARSFLLEAPKR
jgi:hypothetical protein